MRRDDLLERDERRRPRRPATKRGSISFGTFTRAKCASPVCRVAHEDGERQRQVGDVRERAPEADGERREHREDRRRKRSASCSRCSTRELVEADDVDALLGQRRAQPSRRQRVWRSHARRPARACSSSTCDGVRPSGPGSHAGVELLVQAGDADHEELVEVRAEDRRELQPLEERLVGLLGELEHALVEREPGELAVEVELGIVEVGRRRRLGDRRRDRSDRLLLGHRRAAGDAMATRRASLLPSCEGPVTGLTPPTRSLAAY